LCVIVAKGAKGLRTEQNTICLKELAMITFIDAARCLLLSLALAVSALHAQQSPNSPGAVSAAAPQAGDAQCILAGRLNSEGRWAPAASGVMLLDASGQRIRSAGKPALDSVKAVRLAEPALLAKCNGNQPLADGDASAGSKSPAPAVTAGNAPISVQALATVPGRAGAQWVELRLDTPPERVILLTR
jgi:hypothetical protein